MEPTPFQADCHYELCRRIDDPNQKGLIEALVIFSPHLDTAP